MLVSFIKRLYRTSLGYKERQQYHAYYSIPVLVGFLVNYGIIQLAVYLYPNFHLDVRGYHIHHYTYGIVLLLIFGYIGLWTQSLKVKYICALAYGVGAAFIIDEAWLWFTLTQTTHYQDYDLVFFVAALLVGFILAPNFFKTKEEPTEPTNT
jgi:hypothetical protein